MKILTEEEFKNQFGKEAYNSFGTPAPKKTGYLQDAVSDIKQIGSDMTQSTLKRSENVTNALDAGARGEQTPLRTTAQLLGQGAHFASDIVGDVFKGAVKAILPQGAEAGVKKGMEAVITPVMESQIAKNIMQKYHSLDPKTKSDIDAALGVVSLATDVTAIGGALKGGKMLAEQGMKVGEQAAEAAKSGVKKGMGIGQDLTNKGKNILAPPPPTPKEAIGQVLQGKSKDVSHGVRAFQNVDTTGVKSYGELAGKIDESITGLSKKVDSVLDNKKPVYLKDLKLNGKTTAGKQVSVDYVTRAVQHLKEAYKSTGDDIAFKNAKDLLNKAKTKGLTRLEVNNLSRQYGSEFKSKAFGKIGEPLTSVNAVKFENTRKGLKEVARAGLKGTKAEETDKSISSLYKVKDLIKKNEQAVNKLQQRVQSRGLLEKFGYHAAKAADLLSGGSLRGIVGGLLPRGVGYKVMNALDIENALKKNLQIIQKALQGKDEDLLKLLKPSKSPLSKGGTPKTTMDISKLISHEGAPDEKQVIQYMKEIKAGKKIEPIKVIKEGNKFGIEDGKHRFEAYKRLGIKNIPIEEIKN